MSSADVIDALFERTVDIAQSLPKTGPIQTSYEEKLALYSLYKQATEGDVQGKRPGLLDMLGRAKWDAWAKRRGLTSRDAKQLYVENMLRTLRRFRDRPQAMELIEELENYSGDVAERVMSGALAESYTDSGSSAGGSPRLRRRAPVQDSEEEESIISEPAAASLQHAAPSLPPSYITGPGGLPPQSSSSSRRTQLGGRAGEHPPPSVTLTRARSFPQAPTSVENASAAAAEQAGASELASEDEDYARPGELPGPSQHGRGRRQRSRASYTAVQPGGGRSSWQQQYPHPYSSAAAHESRLYALPPSSSKYPSAPPSESAAGAAAGGFSGSVVGQHLYNTAPPATSSQAGRPGAGPSGGGIHHYYHHRPSDSGVGPAGSVRGPYAPSSVGGRSGGGGGGAGRGSVVAGAIGRGAGSVSGAGGPSRSQQVDQALQNIQASLAALHERLNRVESRRGWSAFLTDAGGTGGGSRGSRRRALHSVYEAVANAAHDIAVLLGLRNPYASNVSSGVALAPSYLAQSGGSGGGSGDARSRARNDLFSAPLRLAIALLNLFVRLALDAMSLALIMSALLLIVRRITGRGDPLIILRLIRRWTGIRPGVIISGAAAAATTRVNGGNSAGAQGAAVVIRNRT
ncbi:ACBP-domain-containing protein [Tilletiaria anomala UBC 951]|uniref:ACBP-domain-containing protein n=1 Tax=Tilletiaria anomala (strain ATCC 24038 / CBS 436.72 / UBC 951) TaxID=1037660 RepID=A0A066VZ89_TILAU|nr:ACBP-domain-containing protein [Tilletiaria anomala UBC 951]KDN45608.1 ACBP-domain-containing protein [Tilletiaria anomala UBC 951]